MVRPEALKTASLPSPEVAPTRTDMLSPLASAICEATVLFHIKSYKAASSAPTSPPSFSGVLKSPAGRMASCASWAPLACLPEYFLGPGER